MRPTAEKRITTTKKRSVGHKNWTRSAGALGAQPHAQQLPHSKEERPRRVATLARQLTPNRARTTGRGGQRGAAPTPSPPPKPCPTLQQGPLPSFPTHSSTHLACSAGAARCEGRGCGRGAAATAIAIATALADLREVGGDGDGRQGVGGVGGVGDAGSKHLS